MNEYITIPLSKTGKHAGKYETIISIEDADLAVLNWIRTHQGYAQRSIGSRKNHKLVSMHRIILERMIGRPLTKGEEVDHINRNGLDNRRENLRLATSTQNNANQKIRSDNKSGVRGVSWSKGKQKWKAAIYIDKKQKHLGYFDDKELAKKVYDAAALAYFGEFYKSETS